MNLGLLQEMMCGNQYRSCETEEFREVFTILDTEKNGFICIKELGLLVRALGHWNHTWNPPKKDLRQILVEFDDNKDGVISFEEFIVLITVMTDNVQGVSALRAPAIIRFSANYFEENIVITFTFEAILFQCTQEASLLIL